MDRKVTFADSTTTQANIVPISTVPVPVTVASKDVPPRDDEKEIKKEIKTTKLKRKKPDSGSDDTVSALLLLPDQKQPIPVRLPKTMEDLSATERAHLLLRCCTHVASTTAEIAITLVLDAGEGAEFAASTRPDIGYLALIHNGTPRHYRMERNALAEHYIELAPLFGPILLHGNNPRTGDTTDLSIDQLTRPASETAPATSTKRRKIDVDPIQKLKKKTTKKKAIKKESKSTVLAPVTDCAPITNSD
jgi:hypothetical protein